MPAAFAGRLARLLQIAGVNAIPLGGVLLGDWQLSTAIVTYWFETLVGTAFIVVRMVTHRRLTRKKGYWYAPVQDAATPRRRSGRTSPARKYLPVRQNFVTGFGATVAVFSVAHGLILALFLFVGLKQPPQWPVLAYAVLGVLGFQAIGLGADLVGLRDRPFAWMQGIANLYLGRVVLIHLSIIGGAFAAAYLETPTSFFAVFGGLKLVADLGSWLPAREVALPEAPPRWAVAILARTEPGADPVAEWKEMVAVERERRAFWEEVMPADEHSGSRSSGR